VSVYWAPIVTDADITETPTGSISLIIDTLGAVASIILDISNGAEGINDQWYCTYRCFSGVGDHRCSVNRHRTSLASPSCYVDRHEDRHPHPLAMRLGRKRHTSHSHAIWICRKIDALNHMRCVKNKENMKYFCKTDNNFWWENSTVIKWVHWRAGPLFWRGAISSFLQKNAYFYDVLLKFSAKKRFLGGKLPPPSPPSWPADERVHCLSEDK